MAKLIKGVNDLATVRPDLAKEWHPIKNGDLKPSDVMPGSGKKVWWYLPYDDPKTGKHFDFEWQTTVSYRNKDKKNCCPFLNGRKVWKGFNDLATLNPQLASEWHPTKNGDLTPSDVTCGSEKKVWWILPYITEDGRYFEFEWQAIIYSRNSGIGCPFLNSCSSPKVWKGFNDLATLNSNLASEWHPTKNGNLTPSDVTCNSNKKVWWYLPYDDPKTGKHFDFEWKTTVSHRYNGEKCPFLDHCTNPTIYKGFNDLATRNPELASEWHPTKNGNLTPSDVTCGSQKKVWWLLPYDDPKTEQHFDFEWQATIAHRNNGEKCPFLSSNSIWVNFNDLATINPQLASEWHPTKNGNLTPKDVMPSSNKKAWWYLSYDDPKTGKHFDFEWQASINSRNQGVGCPFLTSSKTELLLYDLMKKNNILFIPEMKFQNCKNKSHLPFDLFLSKDNLIIECDGIQHFKPIDYFGGKNALKTNQKHDNIKNQYCKDNNIALLRIPYTYDPVVDKEKIKQMVSEFINTKQVPQEIIYFYSQHKFSNYVECVNELNKD